MDPHPTPFPGKKSQGIVKPSKPLKKKKDLKAQSTAQTESSNNAHDAEEGSQFEFQYASMEELPTSNLVGKSGGITKPLVKLSKTSNKDLNTQPTAQNQSRANRSFGVSKNPNIQPEKKPETNPLKPNKPTKPLKKNPQVTQNTKTISNETKKKKELKVHFEGDEVAMRTPLAEKQVLPEGENSTPYFTAENCSKCKKIDKLETSSYWLNQIKLAESLGKHFVSVAFFRLALQCNAKPIEKIHSEMKKYMEKHNCDNAISHFADIALEIDSKNEEIENINSCITENNSSEEGQVSNSNHEECSDSSSVILNEKIKIKGKEIATCEKL